LAGNEILPYSAARARDSIRVSLGGDWAYIWDALAGPKGMPPETVARLNREVNALLADPAIRDRLLALGAEPLPMSAEQSAAFVAAETAKWSKVIRTAGMKIE